MFYDLANFPGWLLAALIVGGVVGWMTYSDAPRSAWFEGWTKWASIAFAVGLVAALLRVLPGRLGLWLETALLMTFFYIAGCFLGGWLKSLLASGETTTPAIAPTAAPAADPFASAPKSYPGARPAHVAGGDGDDLTRISGVGALDQKALNDLGIRNYSQIAGWSPDNVAWVEHHLAAPGRVGREGWIASAAALAGTVVAGSSAVAAAAKPVAASASAGEPARIVADPATTAQLDAGPDARQVDDERRAEAAAAAQAEAARMAAEAAAKADADRKAAADAAAKMAADQKAAEAAATAQAGAPASAPAAPLMDAAAKAEADRKAAEVAAKAEADRKAAEVAAKAEADRKAAEAAAKAEADAKLEAQRRVAAAAAKIDAETANATPAAAAPTVAAAAPAAPTSADAAGSGLPGQKPSGLGAPDGAADNLKLIKGIGPKNETVLQGLGVYHFHQIAVWSPDNAVWTGHHMAFPGRIEREHWIPQAQLLAAGLDTDHSTGVKSGAIKIDETSDAPMSDAEASALAANLPAVAPKVEGEEAHAGARPLGLASARGGVSDDLKLIKGIGKQNEARLHGLGVWHFDQIAAWTRDNVQWVGSYLAFPGRIDREDWINQARDLAAGHKTAFAKRVEAGEVKSSVDDGSHGQGNVAKVEPRGG